MSMDQFCNVKVPDSLKEFAHRVGFDLVDAGVDGQRPEVSCIYFTKALPHDDTFTVMVALDANELEEHSKHGANAFARWLWDHIIERLTEALLAEVVDLKQECSDHL